MQNKPQIPQKGNALDNLIFSPLDAGIETVEDNSDFMRIGRIRWIK